MRFFVAFGALTVATGLFVACGDDDSGDGNTAGTGGTGGRGGSGGVSTSGGSAGCGSIGGAGTVLGCSPGGTGGSAGTGGTAGAAGAAGTAGAAGAAGTSGDGDDDPDAGLEDAGLIDAGDAGNAPCTGCLELRATVAQTFATENALFQLSLAADMTGVTVTYRMRGLILDDEVVASPFATDGAADGFVLGAEFTLLDVANGFDTEGEFVDVDLAVSAIAQSGFDDADVIAIGLQIGYNGAIGAESTHTVSVLLDSITFSGDNDELTDLTFDDDAEGLALAGFGVQTAEVIHH